MSPARRRLFGAAVVVAAIITAVLLALTIGQTPPPNQALPNPNGYDSFVQAGNLILGDVSSFSDLDHDALRGLVSSNAQPLRLLRLGLSQRCSFPTDFAITNQGWIAELAPIKHLALLLRAEGRLAEMEGRPGDAAISYTETIRFGNEISRGGLLINRLVGIACEALGASALTKLVPSLGFEQARLVSRELQKIDEERVSFDEIKRNERKFTRHELFKQRNPLELVTGLWQAWNVTRRSATRDKMVIAHERLLATQLALRCYLSDRGREAARLDDLVTNYLAKVPEDPFTGHPMVYHPQGTNWLLYSVGPDGVDDGGKPVGQGLTSKGDLFFDSPW